MSLTDRLHKLDRLQQRSPRLSFPAAVIKKFGDDQAGQLAALIAYYGFVSLFPLLLVLVTVFRFILEGSPKTQASVLHSTLGQFPIIGDQLQHNVHSLKGSPGALAIGLVGPLFGGLGVLGGPHHALPGGRPPHHPHRRCNPPPPPHPPPPPTKPPAAPRPPPPPHPQQATHP